jgi:hypothetical protein
MIETMRSDTQKFVSHTTARRQRSGLPILLIVALVLVGRVSLAGADEANMEYPVKAAMIVNFLQFVEWPPDARPAEGAPIVVGVVGAGNPLGKALEQIVANKTVAGHPVRVLYLNSGASADGCHLLFVPREQDNDFLRISQRISGQPILTVGETDAFSRAGGIIRFYTEDNKVRFQINPDAAEKVNLKISSKLLKLAKIVR